MNILLSNEMFFVGHVITVSACVLAGVRLGPAGLTSFMALLTVLSNIFITKQMVIFGLSATCADAFSVGAGLTLNMLQEYFGKIAAQQAIWISTACLLFYLLMTQFHLAYIPSAADTMHIHAQALLESTPRIIIASLIAYFISQQIESRLYAYFRVRFANKHFVLRNYSSLLISQLIDTILFTGLGLYGLVENMWHVALVAYVVKVITIACAGPVIGFFRSIITTRPIKTIRDQAR